MSNTFSRVLWLVSGIMLTACGAYCLFSPATAIGLIAIYIAAAVLFSGLSDIAVFAGAHRYIAGAGWILTSGIVGVLLSIFLFTYSDTTAAVLPYIFAMWVIFIGVSTSVVSFDLKRLGFRGWGWLLGLGLLMSILGVVSFARPAVSAGAIGLLVGFLLIFDGVFTVVKAALAPRFWL